MKFDPFYEQIDINFLTENEKLTFMHCEFGAQKVVSYELRLLNYTF